MRLLRYLVCCLIYCSITFFSLLTTAMAHETASAALAEELTAKYAECLSIVQESDQDIKDLEKQVGLLTQVNENNKDIGAELSRIDNVIENISNNQSRAKELLLNASTKTEESMNLCQTTIDGSLAELQRVHELYLDAVRDCIRPWYARWEFWMGSIFGLLVGIPL